MLKEDLNFNQCKYLTKFTNISLSEMNNLTQKKYDISQLKQLLKRKYQII